MLYVIFNSLDVMEGVYTCESKAKKACDTINGGYVCLYPKNSIDALGTIIYHSNY